jgi:hypothetical protein
MRILEAAGVEGEFGAHLIECVPGPNPRDDRQLRVLAVNGLGR